MIQNPLSPIVAQAFAAVVSSLEQLASSDILFNQVIATAFGASADASSFQTAWAKGDFSSIPPIEIRKRSEINGANGAFAIATGKIYLSQEFIDANVNNVGAIAAVLLEEYGHYIDSKINVTDSAGDEGDIFARLVQGEGISESELAVLKAEDDSAIVMLDGQLVQIEQNWNDAEKARFYLSADQIIGLKILKFKYNESGNNDAERFSFETPNFSIDTSKKTIFLIHGFTSDPRSFGLPSYYNDGTKISDYFAGSYDGTLYKAIRDKNPEANIITVDWSAISGTNNVDYYWVKQRDDNVAYELSKILNTLKIDPNNTEIIGYSLGAQIAGQAAKQYQKDYNSTINQIVGLDPAGPGYEDANIDYRISPDDARRVVVIHTSNSNSSGLGAVNLFVGGLGLYRDDLGHLDIYVKKDGSVYGSSITAPQKHDLAVEVYQRLVEGNIYGGANQFSPSNYNRSFNLQSLNDSNLTDNYTINLDTVFNSDISDQSYINDGVNNNDIYFFDTDSQQGSDRINETTIGLKTYHNWYVQANSGNAINTGMYQGDSLGTWEEFQVITQDDGKIGLQTINNKFVSAEWGFLVNQQNSLNDNYKKFLVIDRGDGKIALKAHWNNYTTTYIQAMNSRLITQSDNLDTWETFTPITSNRDTDTLDFSATTMKSINVDLSIAGQQTINENLKLTLGITLAGVNYVDIENAIGGSLDDTLKGNNLNNLLRGNNGNDTLIGNAGNDTLIGGAGNDTVVLSGKSTEYKFVSSNSNGSWLVINDTTLNRDGQDTLQDVENIKFSDAQYTTNFESFYRKVHPDVDEAVNLNTWLNSGINHYEWYGKGEGRVTSDLFDSDYYLSNNGDVNTAVRDSNGSMTALSHYVDYGYNEGRTARYIAKNSNDPLWGTSKGEILMGRSGQNIIKGWAGNDTLYGGLGNDTLYGGSGNDTLYGDADYDTVVFTGNSKEYKFNFDTSGRLTITDQIDNRDGVDTVTQSEEIKFADRSYYSSDFNEAFYLQVHPDVAQAAANKNNPYGYTTGLGHYQIYGMNEGRVTNFNFDEKYYLTANTDVAQAAANKNNPYGYTTGLGHYQIYGGRLAKYNVLNSNDPLMGTPYAEILEGADGNNILYGKAGNDVLNGGEGTDTLIGGTDNDTYIVDTTTDTITENTNEGIDTIQSSVTFSLATLPNLENLTLTGTGNINGTGNATNNIITGNTGNNILDGGAGTDTVVFTGNSKEYKFSFDESGRLKITDQIANRDGVDTVTQSEEIKFADRSYYSSDFNEAFYLKVHPDVSQAVGNSNNPYGYTTGLGHYQKYGMNEGRVTNFNFDEKYYLDNNLDVANAAKTNLYGYTTGLGHYLKYGGRLAKYKVLNSNDPLMGTPYAEILEGADGNNILNGKGGKDTLTGGTGVDRFDYRNLSDSVLNNFDVITDFNANSGNDLFLVTTARSGFSNNAGTVTTLDTTGIQAKLNNTNFAANYAAQFTFGSRTFVAINDATAGFNENTDAIIEVTGLTGTLGTSNFTTTLA